MKHVVMFSSGVASWCAAKRVAEQHGTADLTLLFADTTEEDEDNYRFLSQAAANVGGELVILKDGRGIWDTYRGRRYVGNSRIAPCSEELKQFPCRRWRDANCDPAATICYVGFDWNEEHRLRATQKKNVPWRYEAPLIEPPYLEKKDMLAWARAEGIEPPRLYALGFQHANCGGFCCRGGHAQFRQLLRVFPERYARHEAEEERMREMLGADVSILRDRGGGRVTPVSLREFRERHETGQVAMFDEFDWGGCGCFSEVATPEEPEP